MSENNLYNPFKSLSLHGLDNYFDELTKLYNLKKFPKVLQLEGKKGSGKLTLMNHVLNFIFSEGGYDLTKRIIDPNNKYYKQILEGIFENIVYIKNDGTIKVKMENIRALKNLVLKSTINNKPRFIIFDDVEKLSINTSNALLKIIEEPSSNNYFILINNNQNSLIETISSRSLKIKIFLSENNRIQIINSLISQHNIEPNLDFMKLKITPGQFLIFNKLCFDNSIDGNMPYISKINKLLNLYKKNKDKIFIDLSIFFTEIYFYNLSLLKSKKIFLINKNKIKIIQIINNFMLYNLNLTSVLSNIDLSSFNEK